MKVVSRNSHKISALSAAVPKAGTGLFAKENALFTSALDTSTALRLAAVHSFMKTHLYGYPGSSLQEPPKELYELEKSGTSPSVSQKVMFLPLSKGKHSICVEMLKIVIYLPQK